jgi:phospholipid transport system substrate-binding protein
MTIGRRELLQRAMLGAAATMCVGLAPAWALDEAAATGHVRATIEKVLALVADPGTSDSKASALLAIMRNSAAMPEIARFAAGVVWRDMNEDQQKRFTEAFERFLAVVYARRFQEYSSGVKQGAEAYTVDGVNDAGKKGLLVKTSIARPDGAPVVVDWLVTDKPGRIVIADIVIEGVSLLITQREEIGAMFESRGGDVEKLIAALSV